MAPARVAILGGGMAALTAAYELARLKAADGGPRYRIEIYTLGWRLGGKGASGRNAARSQRIEEHGLHIWFGAYANAFTVMRDVYRNVQATDPGKWPHGQLSQAFSSQRGFHLMEERDGDWQPWEFPLPLRQHTTPGDGTAQASTTPLGLVDRVKDWLAGYFTHSVVPQLSILQTEAVTGLSMFDITGVAATLRALATPGLMEGRVARHVQAVGYRTVHRELSEYWAKLERTARDGMAPSGWTDDARHAVVIAAIAAGVVAGVLDSEVFDADDWDVLNDRDLREWLRGYIGDFADSCLITASYDLFFSYVGGDENRGRIEAGTALRAALWLLLEYKGAFMWRMNNGMGDAIFAPLYNALVASGNVTFNFFCRVEALRLDGSGTRVVAMRIRRQAHVSYGDYQPLVPVAGADCWPSRPLFKQLDNGAELEARWEQCNFEWDGSQCGELEDIALGDAKVVLGIPIGALDGICRELVRDDRPAFRDMLRNVKTVRTVAAQLWLDTPLAVLCGDPQRYCEPPIMTTFVNPLDTYADMTHLVRCEAWPPDRTPAHIAYFCGVLSDDDAGKLPGDRAYRYAEGMLTAGVRAPAPMKWLWPAAFHGGGFDWARLCGTAPGAGRLKEQYWRANVDLWERYVLALPGTSRYRLTARGSGYENLVLAGDWIDNGLYLGCIEGTVIAGKQAARAVGASGAEVPIIGEGTLFRTR